MSRKYYFEDDKAEKGMLFSFDLADHDKQIKTEAIEEYKKALLNLIKEEQETRYGYLDEMDIREVAEQLKEQNK